MAKALTAEQREAKNKRERERRAAKKGAVANLIAAVEPEQSEETELEELDELDEMQAQAKAEREVVLASPLGAPVTAPRGGIAGYVQRIFRGGGRFVTEDGTGVYATWCKHTDEQRQALGSSVYFEQVGDGNPDWSDGAHGWAHRFSRCNKVYQVG